jgi:precorrin-3B C17-methyltransferase
VSRARPWQLGKAFALLARYLPRATPVVFGRAVGRADEGLTISTLAEAGGIAADMATLIIVGSRETRLVPRPGQMPLVYTPRAVERVSA